MAKIGEYTRNARIAVAALFPNLTKEQQEAIVWLLVEFLTDINAIYQNMPVVE